MPKFVLDGKEIEFEQGQTIIQAAKKSGITIPHFCWHESLSISGNCRVCLVEIEKMPKLAIACSTLAAEGMVVYSESDKALSARNAVMEFELINHPLDCPICDEAGECKLQDYAYSHGTGESRFNEEKIHKDKRVPLGPLVMFDGDRCISCSRCIRFCDEIVKEPQLTFIKRGDRITIVTYPGKELDNPYSMNVTDICPVGALTSRDFRFKARVWELSSTKSICNGCSRGCNINLEVRNNQVLRLTPRQNEDVNSFWMCDHGRVNTYKLINAEDRVDSPYLRRGGTLTRSGWDEAFAAASSELKSYSKNEIAFIGSSFTTCEDNFLLSKFASQIIGTKHVDFMPHFDSTFGDNFLRKGDIAPNSLGAKAVGIFPGKGGLDLEGIIKSVKDGQIKAVYLMEDNLIASRPELKEIFSKLDLFIVHSSNFNETTEIADIVFPASTYAEKHGTIVNFEGRVQRLRPAVATFDVDRALEGMSLSRWDKFGTKFDSWAEGNKRDARSSWRILAGLSGAMGHKYRYGTAEEVFMDIAKSISAFSGLDYEIIGELGAKLKLDSVSKPAIA